ncbi:hypothetical protein BDFB_009005 [Asbolus verrucosus]|uniref:Sushi domain-containing protein n=1 Tax=Asbolus verrucosus TaxID=1661398 RepID=A0A482VAW0_ASBVE|nr:hypothetical protein BDFB_009005 [Asbolus verrucosus]
MKVTCIHNNKITENCTDAVDGTLAKFECAPYYEDLGLRHTPVHLCYDGSWNQRRPQCVPDVMGKIRPKELFMVAVGKYYESYNDPRDLKTAQFSLVATAVTRNIDSSTI